MTLQETLRSACAYSHNFIVRGGDYRAILSVVETALHSLADSHVRVGRLDDYNAVTDQAEQVASLVESLTALASR